MNDTLIYISDWRMPEMRRLRDLPSVLYELTEPYFVHIRQLSLAFFIPQGFIWDDASWIRREVFGSDGPLVHDYLYWLRGYVKPDRAPLSRRQCDLVFYWRVQEFEQAKRWVIARSIQEQPREQRFRLWIRAIPGLVAGVVRPEVGYLGVRILGWKAWANHEARIGRAA